MAVWRCLCSTCTFFSRVSLVVSSKAIFSLLALTSIMAKLVAIVTTHSRFQSRRFMFGSSRGRALSLSLSCGSERDVNQGAFLCFFCLLIPANDNAQGGLGFTFEWVYYSHQAGPLFSPLSCFVTLERPRPTQSWQTSPNVARLLNPVDHATSQRTTWMRFKTQFRKFLAPNLANRSHDLTDSESRAVILVAFGAPQLSRWHATKQEVHTNKSSLITRSKSSTKNKERHWLLCFSSTIVHSQKQQHTFQTSIIASSSWRLYLHLPRLKALTMTMT